MAMSAQRCSRCGQPRACNHWSLCPCGHTFPPNDLGIGRKASAIGQRLPSFLPIENLPPFSEADRVAAREFWLTEYKTAVDQFHKYYDIHVKGYGLFMGITALLLVNAYDKLTDLRSLMIAMGIFFAIAYFIVLLCSMTIVSMLCSRRARALRHLGAGEIEDDFHPAGRWSCYIYFGIIFVVLVGWGWIIAHPPKPQKPAEIAAPQQVK